MKTRSVDGYKRSVPLMRLELINMDIKIRTAYPVKTERKWSTHLITWMVGFVGSAGLVQIDVYYWDNFAYGCDVPTKDGDTSRIATADEIQFFGYFWETKGRYDPRCEQCVNW